MVRPLQTVVPARGAWIDMPTREPVATRDGRPPSASASDGPANRTAAQTKKDFNMAFAGEGDRETGDGGADGNATDGRGARRVRVSIRPPARRHGSGSMGNYLDDELVVPFSK
jgi:hypothetical protein